MQSNGVTISDWMSLVLVCDGQLYFGFHKMTPSLQKSWSPSFYPKDEIVWFEMCQALIGSLQKWEIRLLAALLSVELLEILSALYTTCHHQMTHYL